MLHAGIRRSTAARNSRPEMAGVGGYSSAPGSTVTSVSTSALFTLLTIVATNATARLSADLTNTTAPTYRSPDRAAPYGGLISAVWGSNPTPQPPDAAALNATSTTT